MRAIAVLAVALAASVASFATACSSSVPSVGTVGGGGDASTPSPDAGGVGSGGADAGVPPSDAGGSTDGPCIPNPADCAGKCGTVMDHCGFAVSCGPCLNDGGGAGSDSGGATGIYCTQASAQQCDCGNVSTTLHAPNTTPCSPSDVGGAAICCSTTAWSSTQDGACFCESWGCTDSADCYCGLGFGPATSCSPDAGAFCCAWDEGPACQCIAGATSCPAGYSQVSSCDVGSATCGAGYTYPATVSSCR